MGRQMAGLRWSADLGALEVMARPSPAGEADAGVLTLTIVVGRPYFSRRHVTHILYALGTAAKCPSDVVMLVAGSRNHHCRPDHRMPAGIGGMGDRVWRGIKPGVRRATLIGVCNCGTNAKTDPVAVAATRYRMTKTQRKAMGIRPAMTPSHQAIFGIVANGQLVAGRIALNLQLQQGMSETSRQTCGFFYAAGRLSKHTGASRVGTHRRY